MFKWIKNLFKKKPLVLTKEVEIDYSKLTKGDLKKLKEQGKIKSIYKPYIKYISLIWLIKLK
jgi:hypothetical protein